MNSVDRQGVCFFGSVTASVSHELKNALAIIGQNSGLLQDYIAMAAKGRSIDPVRLGVVAARIEEQTSRADRLIKYLNRFAHSVDAFKKSVDLNEILDLLELLSARIAAMRQVELACRPANLPVMVVTAPFFLLTFLGRMLWSLIETVSTGANIVLGVATGDTAEFFFEAPVGSIEATAAHFAVEARNALLAELGASVQIDASCGRMTMIMNQPVGVEP